MKKQVRCILFLAICVLCNFSTAWSRTALVRMSFPTALACVGLPDRLSNVFSDRIGVHALPDRTDMCGLPDRIRMRGIHPHGLDPSRTTLACVLTDHIDMIGMRDRIGTRGRGLERFTIKFLRAFAYSKSRMRQTATITVIFGCTLLRGRIQ